MKKLIIGLILIMLQRQDFSYSIFLLKEVISKKSA